jgi:hypothetical protein
MTAFTLRRHSKRALSRSQMYPGTRDVDGWLALMVVVVAVAAGTVFAAGPRNGTSSSVHGLPQFAAAAH